MRMLCIENFEYYVRKHAILLFFAFIISIVFAFLSCPVFFNSLKIGVIENIQEDGRFHRFKSETSYEKYYHIIIKNDFAFICSSMNEIDSFGIDNMIGREAKFRYSDNQVTGRRIVGYLYVDGKKVFHEEDNLILFFFSVLMALFTGWGAYYGIRLDYLKRHPMRR